MFVASSIIQFYKQTYGNSNFDPLNLGTSIYPLPNFQLSVLIHLAKNAQTHFKNQEILLRLHGLFHVVGDIHGNFHDLTRIITSIGYPPENNFLFLGDYVDRGNYSIEVITLLFALMLSYPENVYLLRGNHEFSDINHIYGFVEEVNAAYGSSQLADEINNAFIFMPLAAVINNDIFCVHGGLGPNLTSLNQIEEIERPISDDYFYPIVWEMMWSDPSGTYVNYIPSHRRRGFLFGNGVVKDFLENNQLKKIIRAHEMVSEGVKTFADKLGITVFSSSNYNGSSKNCCGILIVNEKSEISAYQLSPLEVILRKDAVFIEMNIFIKPFNIRENSKKQRNCFQTVVKSSKNINSWSLYKPRTLRKDLTTSNCLIIKSKAIPNIYNEII
jgi:protein phosphatase